MGEKEGSSCSKKAVQMKNSIQREVLKVSNCWWDFPSRFKSPPLCKLFYFEFEIAVSIQIHGSDFEGPCCIDMPTVMGQHPWFPTSRLHYNINTFSSFKSFLISAAVRVAYFCFYSRSGGILPNWLRISKKNLQHKRFFPSSNPLAQLLRFHTFWSSLF